MCCGRFAYDSSRLQKSAVYRCSNLPAGSGHAVAVWVDGRGEGSIGMGSIQSLAPHCILHHYTVKSPADRRIVPDIDAECSS